MNVLETGVGDRGRREAAGPPADDLAIGNSGSEPPVPAPSELLGELRCPQDA